MFAARVVLLSAAALLGSSLLLPAAVLADTPANCTYASFLGEWSVSLSAVQPTPTKPSLSCSGDFAVEQNMGLTLSEPNVANSQGLQGNWTLIYNQGIEVWVGGFVIFAFADYDKAGDDLCSQSSVAWFHSLDGSQWRCASLLKLADPHASAAELARAQEKRSPLHMPRDVARVNAELLSARLADPERLSMPFRADHAYLAAINEAAAGMFTVKAYPELERYTIGQLERRRGMPAGVLRGPGGLMAPSPSSDDEQQMGETQAPQLAANSIPKAWDWRNVNGKNYMSPVRNQGVCGSCYSFASAGMMEARIRVRSSLASTPILSTQDMVSCSPYSQGCDGGFPYLVAGKYGRDYGLLEEACYPYNGTESTCNQPDAKCNAQRWKTAEYYYVGGYYGQSTPQRMQEEIMANGPIAVSFEVYDDFMHYAGGVYTHKFAQALQLDDYNPFELTNHVVVVVGWGETDDKAKTPYWIVKNSWGEEWGEQGYFRILRGSSETGGECAIESLTVSAIPILH